MQPLNLEIIPQLLQEKHHQAKNINKIKHNKRKIDKGI